MGLTQQQAATTWGEMDDFTVFFFFFFFSSSPSLPFFSIYLSTMYGNSWQWGDVAYSVTTVVMVYVYYIVLTH